MSNKEIQIVGPKEVFEGESLSIKCKVAEEFLGNMMVIGLEQMPVSNVKHVVNVYKNGTASHINESFSASVLENPEFWKVTFTFEATKNHSGTYRCFYKQFPTRLESVEISVQVKGMHRLIYIVAIRFIYNKITTVHDTSLT